MQGIFELGNNLNILKETLLWKPILLLSILQKPNLPIQNVDFSKLCLTFPNYNN